MRRYRKAIFELIFFLILLYSADGNYEVTLMTKATLKYTGEVYWKPPAIYKSSCEINVEYFPFDEQSCLMKFGSWTYNGAQVITMYIHICIYIYINNAEYPKTFSINFFRFKITFFFKYKYRIFK